MPLAGAACLTASPFASTLPLTLCARQGLEATVYALRAGFQNFGGVVSSQIGLYAMQVLLCTCCTGAAAAAAAALVLLLLLLHWCCCMPCRCCCCMSCRCCCRDVLVLLLLHWCCCCCTGAAAWMLLL
jgi:hypothetical protein